MLKKMLLFIFSILFSLQVLASGTVLIDGKNIKNRDQVHELFSKQLKYSSQYTNTVESLYDNLSVDFSGESIVKIKHVSLLKLKLGSDYVESMVQAIVNAGEENSKVVMVLE